MAKKNYKLAPLVPPLVVMTPFERLAFDLVGPLPKTKRGEKHLLTTMDYGTKFPDAVLLRKVDSQTVAEAMRDFFPRYGLPNKMLTEQGWFLLVL